MNGITSKLLYLPILFSGLILAASACKKDEKAPDRDKFLADYILVQDCAGQTNSYDITIEASAASEDAVVINNFYGNVNYDLNATVNGDNITIPTQVINSVTFSGTGTISGDILTLNYSLANGAFTLTCTAICTKK